MNQLQLFEDRLSKKPYCSDDLEYGLMIRTKKTAVKKKYIQPNSPHLLNWLIFDCDYEKSLEMVYEKNIPEPNIIATNNKNGHSHLFYSLEEGVYNTELARAKPLYLLAKIEHTMKRDLGADLSYGGLTAKNPLSSEWKVSQIAGRSYDLNYLADCMELPKSLPKGKDLSGLGRNAAIFEQARFIAYGMINDFKNTANFDEFLKSMVFVCKNINNTFLTPLRDNEIYSIAKSISAWTWKKYRGSNSMNETEWKEYVKDTHNSEIQRKRQQKQVESRILKTFDKREQAKELSKKLSQKEIAKILNVSQQTISNWLK